MVGSTKLPIFLHRVSQIPSDRAGACAQQSEEITLRSLSGAGLGNEFMVHGLRSPGQGRALLHPWLQAAAPSGPKAVGGAVRSRGNKRIDATGRAGLNHARQSTRAQCFVPGA